MKRDKQFYIYLFVLGSLFGWIIEFIYTSIKYSHLTFPGCFYGPYLPIYGCGLILIVMFCRNKFKLLEFLKIIIYMSALEYIASVIIEYTTGIMWWDYSRYPLNINGRVCLTYSIFWGILGVIYLNFIENHVESLYRRIKDKKILKYINILFIIIILDMIVTVIRDLIN